MRCFKDVGETQKNDGIAIWDEPTKRINQK
jgi:hypothetical protein